MYRLRDLQPRQFKRLSDDEMLARVVRVGTPGQEMLSKSGKIMWFPDHRMRDTTSLALSPTAKLEGMMRNASLNRDRFNLEEETGLPNLRVLESVMVAMMVRSNGIGLAAPQVGLDLQAFVMGTTPFPKSRWTPYKPRLFVNPQLLDANGNRLGWESCLSVTNDLFRPMPDAAVPLHYLMAREWRDSIRTFSSTALQAPGMGTVQVQEGMVGNLYGLVPRPQSIYVGYYDAWEKWRTEIFRDDLAVLWLHEYGHAVLGQLYPFLVHGAGTQMVISESYGKVDEGTPVDVERLVAYLRNNVEREPAGRPL